MHFHIIRIGCKLDVHYLEVVGIKNLMEFVDFLECQVSTAQYVVDC